MIKNQKDFWAGILFLAFGLAGVYLAQEYPFGTTTRMGPGYFPTVLSGLLALIGLVCAVRALAGTSVHIDAISLKKTLYVTAPVFVFGVIVKGAGLIPATIVVVVASAMASSRFNLKHAALISVGMAVFCWTVFSLGLGLPMPAFGPWLIKE
jgi:hypothetical protein